MFDLMGAIRRKQNAKTAPPADSAETAESAQPRVLELAENLRKPADFSAGDSFSATIRKNPQAPKIGKPASIQGFRDLSANPQNPQPPENKQNPEALLIELAQMLQADAQRLRALLSDADIQNIAEGATSRAHLLAYFRLMRSDGHSLGDNAEKAAPQSRPRHAELMQAWKPAHDALINHLMACRACHAPRARYCTIGAERRQAYHRLC